MFINLNITGHAVDRYRQRVIDKDVQNTDGDIRQIIRKEVKAKFVVLGDGIYPINNTKCAYVIKNSTVITIIPATKLHHDILNNQNKG